MAIEKSKPDPRTLETPLEDEVGEDAYVMTELEDGSVEFDFDEDSVQAALKEGVVNYNDDFYRNLAEDMEDDVLNKISSCILENYEGDKSSRAGWLETVNSGLALLGIEIVESNDPFPGACSAHHPLILESAVKFQAKASNELFNPRGPVKTAIIGKPTEEKEAQALRVRNHMNYQIMYQMEEYFDETEMMLFYLPIVGSAFKKTYYDGLLDRPCSVFVPVDKFVVNYYATSLKSSSCFTHVIDRMSNDLKKDQKNGLYREVELCMPSKGSQTETDVAVDGILGFHPQADEEVYTLLEQYCYLDLADDDSESDEDGIALPYVVTVEAETGTILAVRRNWTESDPQKQMICPFTHYKFVPGLGFYGLGFIHLLGNLQMTLTSAMRSLVDSGAFANLQGGFVDKRLRIRSNDGPISPGEFREVESGGMALKDAVVNLPFKEPSQVLLQMYQFIEARGQKFADSTEQVISDSTNYGPVGTTMALLEASTKFFSGVHKRLHKAQKQEFGILAALNYQYLGESESFDVIGNTFMVSKNDYDGRVDVIPVSDPNIGSQSQKLTIAQAVMTAALQNGKDHNMREVTKYYYNAIGVDEEYIEKFLPVPEEPVASDPISDIKKAQQGKPIAAFPGQDHQSHITIKTAFMNDPSVGQNPVMQAVLPVIQANIQEHIILKFQTEVAGTVAQTPGAEGSTEEAIVAQAAQQVSQKNQKLAELEAQGPDAARNKLADAEIQRVLNESRKLELEIDDKNFDRMVASMELQLKKYAEDNKLLIAEMQTQAKLHTEQMASMQALIQQAFDLKAQAEGQDKDIQTQKEVAEKTKKVDKE
jgi:hypothetical protein